MARSIDILKIYCQAVLSAEISPWTLDPKCIPILWRGDVIQPKGRRLRFGIISDHNGEISVQPPLLRGLAMTKKALEAAGHEVFEWEPLNHPEMVKETNSAFVTLGGAAILNLTNEYEEPIFGSMEGYNTVFKKGENGTLGPTRLREMINKRNALQKAYLDKWSATAADGKEAMDGIITAASPWTAPRLGLTQTLFDVSFTSVFNLLGKSFSFSPREAIRMLKFSEIILSVLFQ